jgi:GH15 family glucan-1,4-alpha-glucosidase
MADSSRWPQPGSGTAGRSGYLPVSEHGLIGDLHTVALVGTNGTIDWHCCPSFDAPSIFGSILDADGGGCFELAAALPAKTRQFYLPDTNVLITRFFTENGVGEIQDFMPVSGAAETRRHRLIRRAVCVRGAMPFRARIAPTTSLPEQIGGERNWDYRYVWIRDAAFCVYALLRLGFASEADAFMRFVLRHATAREASGSGPMQVMYGIDGRTHLPERELPHLAGYRGSQPVRIGNAAASQLQLDVYGELMDSVYLYDDWYQPISSAQWDAITTRAGWLCDHWDQPDEGIWETRGGPRKFLYSQLMCWVAMERAIRMANRRGLPADLERWRHARDAIYRRIMDRGWSPKLNAFAQYEGADVLDAAVLLMPLVKFISPTDPRWLSTLDALTASLVSDSLVYRYDPQASPDGLRGAEGTFSACSFWYVEALTRAGRLEEAQLAFEKVLTYANHLGLYAEQISLNGEQQGNFPQALTHLALISAAFNLDRALG